MCLLYFVGVGAGMILVLRREGRTVPWRTIVLIAVGALIIAAGIAFAIVHFDLHFVRKWPYLTK